MFSTPLLSPPVPAAPAALGARATLSPALCRCSASCWRQPPPSPLSFLPRRRLQRDHRPAVATAKSARRAPRRSVRGALQHGNPAKLRPAPALRDFASVSGGEFIGFEAAFSGAGDALPVPDRFVPDAFREWQVEVYGFEENYSEAVGDYLLHAKRQRIEVKAGCEEDAVSAESEEYAVDLAEPFNVAFPNGCMCVRVKQPNRFCDAERVLFSLVYRDAGAEGKRGGELRRTQIEFDVDADRRGHPPFGERIVVRRELYDQPYNNGQQLVGCGGKVASFVSAERGVGAPSAQRLDAGDALTGEISGDAIEALAASAERGYDDTLYGGDEAAVQCLSLPGDVALRKYPVAGASSSSSSSDDDAPATPSVCYEAAVAVSDAWSIVLARAYSEEPLAFAHCKLYAEKRRRPRRD